MVHLEVQGTTPITYKWFKDGSKLKDGHDFKGSETKELLIRKEANSKGEYFCKVTDRYGEDKDSIKIDFGKLIP